MSPHFFANVLVQDFPSAAFPLPFSTAHPSEAFPFF